MSGNKRALFIFALLASACQSSKQAEKPVLDKLDSTLRNLVARPRADVASPFRGNWHDIGDHVVIDVATASETLPLLAELETLGLRHGATYGPVISGVFPSHQLPELAKLPNVHLARYAARATHAGSVTSEGDIALRTDVVRQLYAIDGTGVAIGTMSDSYNCLGDAADNVASGDLPAGVTVLEEMDDCDDGTDEGRAMMQLIHDVAPGSSQLFHSAFNGSASFATGITDLAAAGADIIVDDVMYFNEPAYQDGIIAQAVDTVSAENVLFFSAAGNNGRAVYERAFAASGVVPPVVGQAAHDWDPGAGTDTMLNVTINPGRVTFALQWDSPFFSATGLSGSSNDLNLYLLNEAGDTIIAQSTSANQSLDPVEAIQAMVDETMTLNVVVTLQSGTAPGRLRLLFSGNIVVNQHATNSPALYGHANAAGAIAVGAAFFSETPEFGVDPPLLESYSSAGGTPILFDDEDQPTSIVRNRPNLVAPDGINNTLLGQDVDDDGLPNFFGTSAAAPHAAAVAALLLSLEPTLSRAEVQDLFESNCIDMGTPGYDFDSGNGLLDAQALFAAVADPPGSNDNVGPGASSSPRKGGGCSSSSSLGGWLALSSIIYSLRGAARRRRKYSL